MIDLSKKPFFNSSGNVNSGEEIEFINWNQDALNTANPYVDDQGFPLPNKYHHYHTYLEKMNKQNNKDLKKIPEAIRRQILDNTRKFQERMKIEATGRHR